MCHIVCFAYNILEKLVERNFVHIYSYAFDGGGELHKLFSASLETFVFIGVGKDLEKTYTQT